jgi:hypothetical protein
LGLLNSGKPKIYFSRRNEVEKLFSKPQYDREIGRKKSKKWQSLRLILG